MKGQTKEGVTPLPRFDIINLNYDYDEGYGRFIRTDDRPEPWNVWDRKTKRSLDFPTHAAAVQYLDENYGLAPTGASLAQEPTG